MPIIMKYKITTIGLLTLFLLFATVSMWQISSAQKFIPSVSAQAGGYSGTGQEAFCSNGSRDWGNFISSVISYDSFTEYWKDILVRYNANMCLYMDIDNLLRKITKIGEQIRKAFYICDRNASRLATTYYQLEAELYFLRRYVDVGNGNFLIKPQATIRNEFNDYLVNQMGLFTLEDSDKLLQQLIVKYTPRIESYKNCSDPTWSNLILKWNELKQTVSGFSPSVMDASETISKAWDSVINTPLQRTGNLLGGLVDLKINSLDPAMSLNDISTQLATSNPDGFTFDQLQTAVSVDQTTHSDTLSRQQMIGQYELLYKQSTSDIVKQIVSRVDALDTIIKNTYPFITQTYQCTKGILDKTCA